MCTVWFVCSIMSYKSRRYDCRLVCTDQRPNRNKRRHDDIEGMLWLFEYAVRVKPRPCVLWVWRLWDCMIERIGSKAKERVSEREGERERESESDSYDAWARMISLRVKDFDWVWKKKWVVQRVSPHVWFWNTHMRAITSFKRLSFTHQQALQTFVWGLKFVWSSQFNQTRWTRFESKDKRKSVNRTLTLFVFKSKSRPCVLWVSRLRDCMLERQRAREKERLKERERERESESERNIYTSIMMREFVWSVYGKRILVECEGSRQLCEWVLWRVN